MIMNRKAVLAVAAGACSVAAVSATDFAISKTLMDIALNRDPPKILELVSAKISRSTRTNAFLHEMERTEELLLQKENTVVNITAEDGTVLTGHWIAADNPERIIIAMHGWRARWSRDFGMIADFWSDENCSVLYAEQRGQNDSSDEHMGFGLKERYDCLAWARWASQMGLPVYLAGISMGATSVLMSADLPLPECVHGIMADCAFTSPDSIWKHVVRDNLHLPYAIRRPVADIICRKKTGFSSDEFTTVNSLKAAKTPVLFIHGTDDNFVPVKMAYENYKSCASPKRIFVVPGADHGMSYYLNREGYENEMRSFWRDFDR